MPPTEAEIEDFCNDIAKLEPDDDFRMFDTSPYLPTTVWGLARQRVAIECERWMQASDSEDTMRRRVIALMTKFPYLKALEPSHE